MIARITTAGLDLKVWKSQMEPLSFWKNTINDKSFIGICVFGICLRLGLGYWKTVAA